MPLHQLLNRSCNSPDVVFRTIRDFLAAANGIEDFTLGGQCPGPGYNIVDASYASGDPGNTTANDWCVLKSTGEAHSYPVYIRLNFGATQHGINPYLHWDSDTHAGFGGIARTTNIYHNGAGDVLLNIYADLDEIHIVIKPRSVNNYYWHPCGRIKPDMLLYDGVALQCSSPITAGNGTVIPLPSWPAWAAVGRKIYNWDTTSLHELEITAIDTTGMTVTVAESFAKAAGSWLAEDVALYTATSHNADAAGSGSTGALHILPTRAGAVTSAQTVMVMPNIVGQDDKYSNRYACDIWLSRTASGVNEVRGRLANARLSRAAASAQGEAWTDEDGLPWRLHTVYNGVTIAFREAT